MAKINNSWLAHAPAKTVKGNNKDSYGEIEDVPYSEINFDGESNIDPTLTKFSLESTDSFVIPNRYQYIVHDLEVGDGEIIVESGGQLVVL